MDAHRSDRNGVRDGAQNGGSDGECGGGNDGIHQRALRETRLFERMEYGKDS